MDIKKIRDFNSLLSWLSDELNWNTGKEDFDNIDDITYNFDAKDIHLKPEEFAKINSLKQLRPLYDKQPWGIFAVEFESKRLEISSLRKILSELIPKRRYRDHAVWEKKIFYFSVSGGSKKTAVSGRCILRTKRMPFLQYKYFMLLQKMKTPDICKLLKIN